jgi:hypothetical protein
MEVLRKNVAIVVLPFSKNLPFVDRERVIEKIWKIEKRPVEGVEEGLLTVLGIPRLS